MNRNMPPCLTTSKDGVILKVLAQPRSAKNQVVGLQEDYLKLKLTAPPVDNAANKLCRDYLAKLLQTSKSNIEIVAGHKSRRKTFLILGLTESEVKERLGLQASEKSS